MLSFLTHRSLRKPPMNKPKASFVTPPLLVLAHLPRWNSQIQRWIEQLSFAPQAHWLLSLDEIEGLVLQNHRAAIIVELPSNFSAKPESTLPEFTRLCNNPQQCPLFGLGDETADPWRGILTEAGATDVCCSVLDFANFSRRIERHLKNSVRDELSVEQKVAARLPW